MCKIPIIKILKKHDYNNVKITIITMWTSHIIYVWKVRLYQFHKDWLVLRHPCERYGGRASTEHLTRLKCRSVRWNQRGERLKHITKTVKHKMFYLSHAPAQIRSRLVLPSERQWWSGQHWNPRQMTRSCFISHTNPRKPTIGFMSHNTDTIRHLNMHFTDIWTLYTADSA